MKPCSNCFRLLPLSEFYSRRQKLSRNRVRLTTQSRCKTCNAEVVRAYNKRVKAKRIQAGWDKLYGRC